MSVPWLRHKNRGTLAPLAYNRLYVFGVVEPGITEASETYATFFNYVTLKP